jgi:carbonic anhydrase
MMTMAKRLSAVLLAGGTVAACEVSVSISSTTNDGGTDDAGLTDADLAEDNDGHAACDELHSDPRWTYEEIEITGPSHWGSLTSQDGAVAYPACASTAMQQSPIIIPNGDAGALEPGVFALGTELAWSAMATVRATHHNGHTWLAALDPTQSRFAVGASTFELRQVHFHSPAEHAIGNVEYPLEAHFVHLDLSPGAQPFASVVAVMFEEGEEDNAELEKVWPKFDKCPQEVATDVTGVSLDLPKLLPSDRTYISYDGSLTTPPCSFTVKFHVVLTPLKASRRQIEMFEQAVDRNDRPHQTVLESTLISHHPHTP